MKTNWKRILLIIIAVALIYGIVSNWDDFKRGLKDGWNGNESSQTK